MDIELKSFGQTLAVGGLALAMVMAWFSMFPNVGRAREILSRSSMLENRFPFVRACLVLAIVFAAGILIEAYAGRVASKRGRLPFNAAFNEFLHSDKDVRLRSLYEEEKFLKNGMVLKLKPISVETLNLRYVDALLPFQREVLRPVLEAVKEDVPLKDNTDILIDSENIDSFKDATNAYYYIAKNIVYSNPQYHEELTALEQRYNFAEAICFVGVNGVVLTIVLTVVSFSYRKIRFKENLGKRHWVVPGFVFVGSLMLMFGGRSAHIDGRIDHHLRVFGYLKATQILAEKNHK